MTVAETLDDDAEEGEEEGSRRTGISGAQRDDTGGTPSDRGAGEDSEGVGSEGSHDARRGSGRTPPSADGEGRAGAAPWPSGGRSSSPLPFRQRRGIWSASGRGEGEKSRRTFLRMFPREKASV